MKKTLILILLVALTSLFTINSTFGYIASDWTLNEDGFYYYNKEFIVHPDKVGYSDNVYVSYPSEVNMIKQYKHHADWFTLDDSVNQLYFRSRRVYSNDYVDTKVYMTILGQNPSDLHVLLNEFLIFDTSNHSNYEDVYLPKMRYKIINPDIVNTVADLPSTSGNPFENGGSVGSVNFSLNGLNLTSYYTYNNNVYVLKTLLDPSTDLVPFQFNNAFYYTYKNEKFLLMNHDSKKSMFYGDNSDVGFIPYTIWNLSTNEIQTFDKLSVYLYVHVDNNWITGHRLYGYFYIDQFIIDELISVTLSYRWAYHYILFGLGDWRHVIKTLSNVDKLSKAKSNWIVDILSYGSAHWLWKSEVPQITKLSKSDVNNDLLSKINFSYNKLNSNFDSVKESLPLFELYIDIQNHAGASGIKIYEDLTNPQNKDNFSIIEFTYMREGKIKTIQAKDIDLLLYFSEGSSSDGTDTSLFDKIISILIIVLIIVAVVYLIKNKVLTDPKKLLFTIIIVAAMIWALSHFGIIKFLVVLRL